jgi:hypothetical protein
VVASEYLSKLYLIADSVRLNRTDAALVRVVAPVVSPATGGRQAEHDAVRFVKELLPELFTYLPS